MKTTGTKTETEAVIVITISDSQTQIQVPRHGSINGQTYRRVVELTHICSKRRSLILSLFLWLDIKLAQVSDWSQKRRAS